ncbi:MAG: SDR family NAD(P)-dependent oxidoreductase, partial [Synechococcus sp. BS307-5m-G39]|nr:SDR family NAD(P)-dependent oxidoreductase [Synechococcus sp. BS307-5m-G39]
QSIPRRLVARCCLEALDTPGSIGRILEVTSNAEQTAQPLSKALLSIDAYGAAASTAR